MAEGANDRAPLRGIRVIDMTWAWAGPHGTQLLAMLGAEVIKVESRARLDHSRVRSLMGGVSKAGPDQSPVFNDLNLNKLSLTLDLREEEARGLLRRLVAVSDVLVENMRP
ncbi:MAG: CoA transferase, partial [Planctomycetota bacterium]